MVSLNPINLMDSRGNPRMGPIHFVKKIINVLQKWTLFLAEPIYKLFKSHVHYALTWILRILGPIKFRKGPIKISKGLLKFGNLHVFESDMGLWSILMAHHHFGLGLSLGLSILFCFRNQRLCGGLV